MAAVGVAVAAATDPLAIAAVAVAGCNRGSLTLRYDCTSVGSAVNQPGKPPALLYSAEPMAEVCEGGGRVAIETRRSCGTAAMSAAAAEDCIAALLLDIAC